MTSTYTYTIKWVANPELLEYFDDQYVYLCYIVPYRTLLHQAGRGTAVEARQMGLLVPSSS